MTIYALYNGRRKFRRISESQISSSEGSWFNLELTAFTKSYNFDYSLGYKNYESCKILPKFSSTLHFLQESYKFVHESQIFQVCYNVEHFLKDSDNVFEKKAFFCKKFLQKM